MEIAMKTYRALVVSLAASFAVAGHAMAATPAPTEATRLTSQYSDWAGGKSNADTLVAGLRNGSTVTLVTNGADRSTSIAGFTPSGSMSYGNVSAALSSAQRSLARLGITHPTAEQIQAALIGGEVLRPNGATAVVRGTVAPRGESGPVATR
jgi:hypothetical protein